jgi:hypothetical protein
MLMYDSATAHEHQELLSMINCIIGGKEFSIDVGMARIKKFLLMRAIERHGGNVAMARKALGLAVNGVQHSNGRNPPAVKKGRGRRKRVR